jgi:hypothetical protein
MKPSLPILVTSAVFIGTIGVLGVAIERQVEPAPLPPIPAPKAKAADPCPPQDKDAAKGEAQAPGGSAQTCSNR